jgi:hypothetical protein
LVRSPVGPSTAKSHLTTSTNIFNELQPQAGALIYTEIGLFPERIVTSERIENLASTALYGLLPSISSTIQAQAHFDRGARCAEPLVFRTVLCSEGELWLTI